jgi:hypothetical protein
MSMHSAKATQFQPTPSKPRLVGTEERALVFRLRHRIVVCCWIRYFLLGGERLYFAGSNALFNDADGICPMNEWTEQVHKIESDKVKTECLLGLDFAHRC